MIRQSGYRFADKDHAPGIENFQGASCVRPSLTAGRVVMSAPVQTDDKASMFPTMYAPPWAREATRDVPGDAGMAAVEKALNASDEFRRTLPTAAPLELPEKKGREKPFEGDIAVRHLRERGL